MERIKQLEEENARLRNGLHEAIIVLDQYARELNIRDNYVDLITQASRGHRRQYHTVDAWLERVDALRRVQEDKNAYDDKAS